MQFLNEMGWFVEVVKAKSFTKVAETCGVPKSTLSHKINQLEQHLGLRLLNRTTRKLELTEAGQIYFERAAKIVEEARLAHQQLGDLLENLSSVLRMSLPVDFANRFIVPLLPEFQRRYPQLQIEFDVTPRNVDLISEPFDLVIRIGEQPNSNLISRKLTTFDGGLYASPSYIAKRGEPQTPRELPDHQVLLFRTAEWQLSNGNESHSLQLQGQYRTNSLGMLEQLAIQGLGIALLPHRTARFYTEQAQLCPLLPDWHSPPVPVYILTATRLLPAKVEAFIGFLKEQFAD
ncbi:DNA-binding transcriptional LysR family regulator [Cricetibacter osteomyelitidis]|uniref:DNA-binding transcriptional LysR family regulator n=1 Tax=Cricetibacter osteomyelitidis TaxID=1521931 RepID=A0A4R2T305_9PAST|nr:LysR family transcriptional regulator [Cricetibacter osteomyelitidis]TCP97309.1 DNA-binding transcriptional LysR family regulator [Cricetibacter osteomyelitidis]